LTFSDPRAFSSRARAPRRSERSFQALAESVLVVYSLGAMPSQIHTGWALAVCPAVGCETLRESPTNASPQLISSGKGVYLMAFRGHPLCALPMGQNHTTYIPTL